MVWQRYGCHAGAAPEGFGSNIAYAVGETNRCQSALHKCRHTNCIQPFREDDGSQFVRLVESVFANLCQGAWKRHGGQVPTAGEGTVSYGRNALCDVDSPNGRATGVPRTMTIPSAISCPVGHRSCSGDGKHAVCQIPSQIGTARSSCCPDAGTGAQSQE